EIGLDGVAATAERVLVLLGSPAEAHLELRLAAITQVADPPGQAHPHVGAFAGRGVVVVPAPEAGIGADGVDLDLAQGDLLGRGSRPAHWGRPRRTGRYRWPGPARWLRATSPGSGARVRGGRCSGCPR